MRLTTKIQSGRTDGSEKKTLVDTLIFKPNDIILDSTGTTTFIFMHIKYISIFQSVFPNFIKNVCTVCTFIIIFA